MLTGQCLIYIGFCTTVSHTLILYQQLGARRQSSIPSEDTGIGDDLDQSDALDATTPLRDDRILLSNPKEE